MKWFNLAIIFLCLTLVGCNVPKINIDWGNETDTKNDNYVSDITKSLDDRSKEECLYLYKVYAGGALYLEKNASNLGTTMDWETLLQKVHKQNGWLTDDLVSKDKDFSEVMRAELEARGFADPKSLSDVNTSKELGKILNETAEGALKAYKSK